MSGIRSPLCKDLQIAAVTAEGLLADIILTQHLAEILTIHICHFFETAIFKTVPSFYPRIKTSFKFFDQSLNKLLSVLLSCFGSFYPAKHDFFALHLTRFRIKSIVGNIAFFSTCVGGERITFYSLGLLFGSKRHFFILFIVLRQRG